MSGPPERTASGRSAAPRHLRRARPGRSRLPRSPGVGQVRRSNIRDDWIRARSRSGTADVHFHDLRHTGNTLAASGVSLRELMTRMGHSTPPALIYQHGQRPRPRDHRPTPITAAMGYWAPHSELGNRKVGRTPNRS
ncbi:tyrosine-type recombinase/integrase [Streptomyces sp. NPDC006207]